MLKPACHRLEQSRLAGMLKKDIPMLIHQAISKS
jgi:hypothetical protein